jgi:hypothetical protein
MWSVERGSPPLQSLQNLEEPASKVSDVDLGRPVPACLVEQADNLVPETRVGAARILPSDGVR